MSYDNPRIKALDKPVIEIMIDFAEGNPGAASAMAMMIEVAKEIDPDCAFGPLNVLFSLDNMDCYGSNIWLFYKDICKQNLLNCFTVFRAIGYGLTSDAAIRQVIENARSGKAQELPFEEWRKAIQNKIPAFGKAA